MKMMCDHQLRSQLLDHAKHCYPLTTAYIVVVVTALLIMAILEAAGVFS